METTFGALLKGWRDQRRLSQLDLGLSANVSARHISFLETGRSKPSRAMVLLLSETLGIPRESRNALLNAAGFAPAFVRRDLGDPDMTHVRAALEWTMQRHEPFPAIALDRHWRLVRMNAPARAMLGQVGLAVGASLLDALAGSATLRAALVNWDEVVSHMIVRLRTESAHLGGDPVLDSAATALADELGRHLPDANGPLPAVIPAVYRSGEAVLSFFSTIAQFGTAQDIMLADLRIELLFPADEATSAALLAMASPPAESRAQRPSRRRPSR